MVVESRNKLALNEKNSNLVIEKWTIRWILLDFNPNCLVLLPLLNVNFHRELFLYIFSVLGCDVDRSLLTKSFLIAKVFPIRSVFYWNHEIPTLNSSARFNVRYTLDLSSYLSGHTDFSNFHMHSKIKTFHLIKNNRNEN